MNSAYKYLIQSGFIIFIQIFLAYSAYSEDKIELKTIKIKGNKELPKILYVVPWQEAQKSKQKTQKLELTHFFGDLYEPISVKAPKTKFD